MDKAGPRARAGWCNRGLRAHAAFLRRTLRGQWQQGTLLVNVRAAFERSLWGPARWPEDGSSSQDAIMSRKPAIPGPPDRPSDCSATS